MIADLASKSMGDVWMVYPNVYYMMQGRLSSGTTVPLPFSSRLWGRYRPICSKKFLTWRGPSFGLTVGATSSVRPPVWPIVPSTQPGCPSQPGRAKVVAGAVAARVGKEVPALCLQYKNIRRNEPGSLRLTGVVNLRTDHHQIRVFQLCYGR